MLEIRQAKELKLNYNVNIGLSVESRRISGGTKCYNAKMFTLLATKSSLKTILISVRTLELDK